MPKHPQDPMEICQAHADEFIADHEVEGLHSLAIHPRAKDADVAARKGDLIWELQGRRFGTVSISFATPCLAKLVLVLDIAHRTTGVPISTERGMMIFRSFDDLLTAIADTRVGSEKSDLGDQPDLATPLEQALLNLQSNHGRLRLLQEMESCPEPA